MSVVSIIVYVAIAALVLPTAIRFIRLEINRRDSRRARRMAAKHAAWVAYIDSFGVDKDGRPPQTMIQGDQE